MRVVVIGDGAAGNALLGKELVHRGHDVLTVLPGCGVSTLTGEGLGDALAGAQVVVDAVGAPSFEGAAALEFFRRSVRNLVAEEEIAGVKHHVALSIVGADRIHDAGYFRAKWTQEMLVRSSRISNTIVRSTQLFECIGRVAQAGTQGREIRLPPVLVRPVAADDVASAVADAVTGAQVVGTLEVAGPETFALPELCERLVNATRDERKVIADARAKYFGVEVGGRSLLPGPNARIGSIRFEDWIRRSALPRRQVEEQQGAPA